MTFARKRTAGPLAALATFGLVLAPVLHGQLHASEAEQESRLPGEPADGVRRAHFPAEKRSFRLTAAFRF